MSSRLNFASSIAGTPLISGNHARVSPGSANNRASSQAPLSLRAAVATDEPVTLSQTYSLEDGSKLEVLAVGSTDQSRAHVILELHGGPLVNAQLIAHWGAIRRGTSGWTLPGLQPDGTRPYKNRALQSPFTKVGDRAKLKIEVVDAEYSAVEFTLKDDATNAWFKCHGTNFHVDIPKSRAHVDPATIVIPEELVRVQAFLRWERNGKQHYSQEKEKEEYELGRLDLQKEVAAGGTIQALEERLLGGGSIFRRSDDKPQQQAPPPPPPQQQQQQQQQLEPIPNDLIAIQAYVRWERAGKPHYDEQKQGQEFIEAKRELEEEVRRGTSVLDIRKRLTGGSEATAPPPPPSRPQPSVWKIDRKQWGYDDLISTAGRKGRKGHGDAGDGAAAAAVAPAPAVAEAEAAAAADPLELAAQIIAGAGLGEVLLKKYYKLNDKKLLVLLIECDGELKVRLASDYPEPLVLHWGLSKGRSRSWQTPPPGIAGSSTRFERACETEFNKGFAGEPSLQSLQLDLAGVEQELPGMPFVVRAGECWFKDYGRDFFLSLNRIDYQQPKDIGDGRGVARAVLDEIADLEPEAEKSLMHRFNLGTQVLDKAKSQGELGLAAVFVWFRFMASRQLVWNKNYNVKPREISVAQDRFTTVLEEIFRSSPSLRELTRMIMMTVGRGGQGDVGQRIRDEILVIQSKNHCKGGMMEEWHQKLHNNTSPDDVVICQALIDYLNSDFNIDVYWRTLNSNGVTHERLLSYDRPICSEPRFVASQKEGLLRDLAHYMKSLKAVHSGADLESAIATCMGYKQGAKADFMKNIEIHPISGLSGNLPNLLQFVLEHVEDRQVVSLVEGLVEARRELRPTLLRHGQERLKDLVFLDLALDSTARTAIERGMGDARNAGEIMYLVTLLVENLCLSIDDNEELVFCLKEWRRVLDSMNHDSQWALRAKAVLDRTRLILQGKAEQQLALFQPAAVHLGSRVHVEQWAIDIFTEEVIRAGSAAALSQLLNRLDPQIRQAADLGSWQVISPADVRGWVEVVDELAEVQEKTYDRPTVMVARRVKGEEEIPAGVVALLTPDMPDVLSHVSVRARNCKVCFATCFDPNLLDSIRALQGKSARCAPNTSGSEVIVSEIDPKLVSGGDGAAADLAGPPPGLHIKRKQFAGRYAVTSNEFTPELVGAKSRNIAGLQGKLPSWIHLPTSVALPFGSFESALADPINQSVAAEIKALSTDLEKGDVSMLPNIRRAVLGLKAPPQLVSDLKEAMKRSNMPWPGDEGEGRWEKAWGAITRVWASKWNERAYVSMRKARLHFNSLSMAVLVQEIVRADYAFVVHTENPSTGDKNQIYAEVVKGLGETLVGAFAGRALSFSADKGHTDRPKVLGFPSKRVGLFIRSSIIFRSDSNGEDLEGYAGAGLYDSVPMDEEEERVVDYSSDPLVVDSAFQHSILSKIASAGEAIEQLLGSAQDIEGVIKDGKLYVVQTRPQM
ncbi:unnamed protein product [Closterium sp. Naga37s-1]|nr:unnamed protein product [Closterium sp. Naga37s-1]